MALTVAGRDADRPPVAARQLASRARRRVQGADPPEPVDVARQRDVVEAFLAALRQGDFDGLVSVLDPDVVLLQARRTGRPGPPQAVQSGAGAVAAHARKFSFGARFAHPALVNGAPGVALVLRGRLIGALDFSYKQGRIAQICELSSRRDLGLVDLTG